MVQNFKINKTLTLVIFLFFINFVSAEEEEIYLKAISKIAPKFVVMENVKGMLPYANQVVEDYKNIKIKKENKTFSY